jgi:uncharacterized protein YlxW (UPF0749 family)
MKVLALGLAVRTLALFCIMFLAPVGFAQTAPKSTRPAKSKALLKVESDLRAMTAERDQLRAELDTLNESIKSEQAAVEQLKKNNDALNITSAYRIGLLVILSKEIRGLPLNDLDKQVLTASATDSAALTIAADIEKNVNEGVGIIKKLADDNSKLTDRYNSLLSTAQTLQLQLNAATSRQQRVNNALALYSLMPKYTPPQTVNVQVTNCNLLPALCVH